MAVSKLARLPRYSIARPPPSVELLPFSDADVDQLLSWVPSEQLLVQWSGASFTFPLTRSQLEDHLRNAVLGAFREARRVKDVIAILAGEFDAGQSAVTNDVLACTSELVRRRLIQPAIGTRERVHVSRSGQC